MTEFSGSDQEGGNRRSNDWLSPRRFSLLLAFLVAIPFFNVLLGGHTFVIRDFPLFSYPVGFFVKESFWRGEIPHWNPMSYCGVPFLAQFNTLSVYPLSIIYCLLPLAWALPFFCLLHTYLAGLGMYFLARRWSGSNLGGAIAGVVFALNGLSLSLLMWPSHIAGYAWMPWTVFFAETAWKRGGRDVIIAGIVCALQVLTGSPEEILFAWIFMFVLAIVQLAEKQNSAGPLALRFIGIGIIAVGLSAPAWLPFVDLAAHSQRDNHFGSSNLDWSMPLFGWANFFVPLYKTQRWQGLAVQISQYWTSSYYVGIATIFLAVIAILRRRNLRVVLLGIAALLSVLLAFGDAGHLYTWMRHILPFLGMFRYSVKFVMFTAFVLPLLAAYAIAHFEIPNQWSLEWPVAAILLAVIGLILCQYLGQPHSTDETSWHDILINALSRAAFLIATLAALYAFSQKPRWRAWAVSVLIVLIWADLLTHVPWQNPTTDSSLYQPGLAQMKVQLNPKPTLGESRLMMTPAASRALYFRPAGDPTTTFLLERVMFLGNLNFLDSIPKADGFLPLNIKQTAELLRECATSSSNKLDHLKDLLGISQTEKSTAFEWRSRDSYLPIVSAGQEPVFAPDATNLVTVCEASTDIRDHVYLPLEAKNLVKAKREKRARIVDKNFGYNKVSVTVDTPTPAMTLITQSYYHNWKAYIDGAPATLWRANYAFQAVEMPAGKHQLKLVYEDAAFRFGVVLFALTALTCAGLLAIYSKRNKKA